MVWFRITRFPAILGATTVCGGCLARTCLASDEQDHVDKIDDTVVDDPTPRGLTLKQVQVFFRHGARTPIHLIPNVEQAVYNARQFNRIVPHTTFNFKLTSIEGGEPEQSPFESHYGKTFLKGGCNIGFLTPLGQQQMYELGEKLRREYVNKHQLLTGDFKPEELFVRSTNIARTVSSARCVVAGIYGAQEINRVGGASIHTSKVLNEVLLPNTHNCEVVRAINHASLIHFDNIPGIKEIRLQVEKILGMDSAKSGHKLNLLYARDDIVARQAHGLPLPACLQSELDLINRTGTEIMYRAVCGLHSAERTLALRMSAGPAVTMAVDEMKRFVSGKSKHKICLYSTHDSLILPITVILDMFDGKWPPFASDIRLELYSDAQGEHWVRALYLGKVQKIRGCSDNFCRYSDFLKSVTPYLIQRREYDSICKSNILEKIAQDLLQHEPADDADEEQPGTPAGL